MTCKVALGDCICHSMTSPSNLYVTLSSDIAIYWLLVTDASTNHKATLNIYTCFLSLRSPIFDPGEKSLHIHPSLTHTMCTWPSKQTHQAKFKPLRVYIVNNRCQSTIGKHYSIQSKFDLLKKALLGKATRIWYNSSIIGSLVCPTIYMMTSSIIALIHHLKQYHPC